MCGRFTLTTPPEVLADAFGVLKVPSLSPRYNIAPTQEVAVVRSDTDGGGREMSLMRWGLIPSWADDPKIGSRMINARAETAASKPAYRTAFRQRRCLLPASGFYEWKALAKGKQPYYFQMRDGGPFAFAGLWERWTAPDDRIVETCTVLTTDPNELLLEVHDRMPVILSPDAYDLWLDPTVRKPELVQPLLVPYPASAMKSHPVSRRVNTPSADDPSCAEPAEPGPPVNSL